MWNQRRKSSAFVAVLTDIQIPLAPAVRPGQAVSPFLASISFCASGGDNLLPRGYEGKVTSVLFVMDWLMAGAQRTFSQGINLFQERNNAGKKQVFISKENCGQHTHTLSVCPEARAECVLQKRRP